MLVAAVVYAICNIIIMVGMLISSNIMVFVTMIISILLFGLTYSITQSIYPAEILKN